MVKRMFGSYERGVFLKVCLWTWPPGDVEVLVFIFPQRVFFLFYLCDYLQPWMKHFIVDSSLDLLALGTILELLFQKNEFELGGEFKNFKKS